MNSIEQMAQQIIRHFGPHILDVQEAADQFAQDAAVKLFRQAGASEAAAHYLTGCLSLGICAVMAELMPALKTDPDAPCEDQL